MHNATQIEVILWIEALGNLGCGAEKKNQGYLSLLRRKARVFIQSVWLCGIEFSEVPA
jgi:hypothetical protein